MEFEKLFFDLMTFADGKTRVELGLEFKDLANRWWSDPRTGPMFDWDQATFTLAKIIKTADPELLSRLERVFPEPIRVFRSQIPGMD